MPDSVVRNRGEGRAFWMLGGLYEVRVSSEETNGAMTVTAVAGPNLGSHVYQRRSCYLRQLQINSQMAHVDSVRNIDRDRFIMTGEFSITGHQDQRIT